jgi:hypothetical protein
MNIGGFSDSWSRVLRCYRFRVPVPVVAVVFALVAGSASLEASAVSVSSQVSPAVASSAIRAYAPITPTRFMDTRAGLGGAGFGAGESRSLQVSGRAPIPASGAVAVTLNVTVTEPSGSGYVTVWPSDRQQPLASNLNFVAGETIPNFVTVGLGIDGAVKFFSQVGTHLVVDVVGYFYAGFNPVTPARVMDTRSGLSGFVLGPGETRELQIQGNGGLPATAFGSVALNVTVTEPTATGFISVWPTGTERPLASNLNFTPQETIPNAVLVGLGSGGKVSLYNSAGSTNLVVDVAGWFDLGFDAVTPTRLMDTRSGLGGVVLGPGATRTLRVTGSGGIPTDGVGGVSLNVTVTEPTVAGYLTVWPAGRTRPLASNLNFIAGQTIPNAVSTGVNANGDIEIYNNSGNSHVVVDVTGWYAKSDTEAPQLQSLSWTPSSVNTSAGAQTITVTARITDDLSGFDVGPNYTHGSMQVRFVSPSNSQIVDASVSELVSGLPVDCIVRGTVTLPAFAESGIWTVQYVNFSDQVGNSRSLNSSQLASAGFPTTFTNN